MDAGPRTPRDVVAFHEAGHAIAAHRLGVGIDWIRLRSTGATGAPDDERHWEGLTCLAVDWPEGSAEWCEITLAGPACEAFYRGLEGIPPDGDCQEESAAVVGYIGEEVAGGVLAGLRHELAEPQTWEQVRVIATHLLTAGQLDGRRLAELIGRPGQ